MTLKERALFGAAIAVLIGACGGGGTNDESDGGDTGDSEPGASLEDFLAGEVSAGEGNWTSLAAQAYCQRVSECNCPPEVDCEQTIDRALTATLVPAENLAFEFDAPSADQCVRDLAADPCGESLWRNSCFRVYQGTLPLGADCVAYGECVGGFCDGLFDGPGGTCVEGELGDLPPESYCLE